MPGTRTAKADVWSLQRAAESVQVAIGGRFLANSVGMIRRLATLDGYRRAGGRSRR
jgi:hypothetical protein